MGTRVSGGDQRGGGGKSEQEVRRAPSIATWMERRVPRCEASRGEARRGCTPRALNVPEDAQLMSYLGRSTLGSVCKGEKSVREGWHNHSNHRTGNKNGMSMVIKEMPRSEMLYLVELTQSELKWFWERVALEVWIYVNDLLFIRRVFSHGIKGIVKLTHDSLTWRIYHLWKMVVELIFTLYFCNCASVELKVL